MLRSRGSRSARTSIVPVAVVVFSIAGCAGSDDAADELADEPTSDTAAAADTTGMSAATDPVTTPVADAPTSSLDEPSTTVEPEPSTTVAPEPDPSTTAAPDPDPSAERDFSAIDPIVQAYVDENGLNGAGLIVVDADDGVVHEDYWGEFDEDRISLVASSSKSIVAGILLNLDDRGLLDLDAPVADVVDWGAGNPDITPAQLVSNSSGLVGLLPDPAYGPYVCQFVPTGSLQACAEEVFTTSGDDADVIAPDTEFRYGGAQWQVAGAVAEVASGRSWDELVDEIYVEPCGLETLSFNNHFTQIGTGGFDYPAEFDGDPSVLVETDNPNMEGGAYVTTGDYAELLLMQLRGGMCGDTQVLSPEALATMHGDRIGDVYGGEAFSPDSGYGMGWWVDRTTGRLTDPGAYGAVPWLDLKAGHGAFLVVESDAETGSALAAQLYDVVDAAFAAGG